MRSIYEGLKFYLFLLLLPGVLTAQEDRITGRGSFSLGSHFSYVSIYSVENKQPHKWLYGIYGGPDMALQIRRNFPGGFAFIAGYHLSYWFDGRSQVNRMCDIYQVCITNMPLKIYQYEYYFIQHGAFVGTQWEFKFLHWIKPLFSLEFRMDRVESRTRLDCEYLSEQSEEKHLFKGSSRLQSRYSPGLAVGAGFRVNIGRFQIVPELRYIFLTARISTEDFDEWIYTHIWREGDVRYTFQCLQNNTDVNFKDERYTIRAFEFRIFFGLRIFG
jgi:hypothetical protein